MDGKVDTMTTDIGGPPEEMLRMKRAGDLQARTSTTGQ
jgi:hypothetical protein